MTPSPPPEQEGWLWARTIHEWIENRILDAKYPDFGLFSISSQNIVRPKRVNDRCFEAQQFLLLHVVVSIAMNLYDSVTRLEFSLSKLNMCT